MRLFENRGSNSTNLPRQNTLPFSNPLLYQHHESKYKIDNFDLFSDIDITEIVSLIILEVVQKAQLKVPRSTRLSGTLYLKKLLNYKNEKRIYLILRINKKTFLRLCQWFRKNSSLKDTVYITIS